MTDKTTGRKGKWDTLFAFRDAAMRNDIPEMARIVADDQSFIDHENPDRLPMSYLAKVIQLHTLIQRGESEGVRALIEETRQLINEPWTSQGWLPLTQAAIPPDATIFDMLVNCGADLKGRAQGGYTVLHSAAYYGNVAVARQVLDQGMDVNVTQDDGTTPLALARARGHHSVIELLISRGATE